MYRSIIKDVSISEMLELREQGLTNREIAIKLDITSQTVRKYIGAMPSELRSKAIREQKIPQPTTPVEQLPICNLRFTIQGKFANYEIDPVDGTINIMGNYICGKLKSAQIKGLCEEFLQMNAQYASLALRIFATGIVPHPTNKTEEK
jgi:hypothetical protein